MSEELEKESQQSQWSAVAWTIWTLLLIATVIVAHMEAVPHV